MMDWLLAPPIQQSSSTVRSRTLTKPAAGTERQQQQENDSVIIATPPPTKKKYDAKQEDGPTAPLLPITRASGKRRTSRLPNSVSLSHCTTSLANLPVKTAVRLLCILLGCMFVLYGIGKWMFPRTMYHKLLTKPEIRKLLEEAPAPVSDQYVVFVTKASPNPNVRTHVAMGKSVDSAEVALKHALEKLPLQSAIRHPWFKIDVITAVQELEAFDYSDTLDPPSWWYGLALDWDLEWVFLPDEVFGQGLVDKKNRLRWDHIAMYGKRDRRLKEFVTGVQNDDATTLMTSDQEPKPIQLLHTNAMLVDFQANEVIPVYHGHRMFPETLTHSLLMESAKEAGRYLSRIHKPDGEQVYLYKPRSDFSPEEYNLTRHAGVLFAMAVLYKEWPDPELLDAMKRGFDYLIKTSVFDCPLPYEPTKKAKCVWDYSTSAGASVASGSRPAKLGVNALALLAMASYQDATGGDTAYQELATSIADWIVGAQKDDGSFVQKVGQPGNELDEEYYVRYYQGEAAYALSKLYNTLDKSLRKESWIEAADAAAVFIIHRDNAMDEADVLIDHWLMYGIGEMHKSQYKYHNKLKLDYAMYVVELANKRQWQEWTQGEYDHDRLGTFGGKDSATASATKTEGVCAVHHLAMDAGKKKEFETILKVSQLSLRYQLEAQFRPEGAMYMKNPSFVLGGFHAGLKNFEMRNDYTQHNLCSILCTAHLLKEHEVEWSA